MEEKISTRLRFLYLWVGALAFAAGCQPTTESNPANFGQFIGDIVASWDDDGRHMTLRETFAYVDPKNRRWVAPAGSVVNGASIPSAFWSLIGGPFEGKYRNASVVHDVGCSEMRESWEDVHRMFYEACRCGGVDAAQAKVLYYAVYHFGPRWQPVTETVVEQRETDDGRVVEEEVPKQRMARIDPPPPTREEIEQVEAYVAEEDPGPEAIKKFSRDSLRRRPRRGRGPSYPLSRTGNPTSRKQSEVLARQGSPGGGRSESHPWQDRPGEPRSRPHAGKSSKVGLPAVTPKEQQWAIEQVRQYIEQQAGEPRPAKYTVESERGAFRVFVQFLHEDEQDPTVTVDGGDCTARISRQGQILEFINGT